MTSVCDLAVLTCTIRYGDVIALCLDRFPAGGQLVEINAHSLFSKWFSESGKLVMKMFGQIQELAEDEESFICVLIGRSHPFVRPSPARANLTCVIV
eukprot:GFYU01048956.1.p2 GENE.GFYU01048956.1~~GFYU01048956.1.p2  ORF type:complete len:109 (-),score=16.96 GFYU01048956.1:368-658(-)